MLNYTNIKTIIIKVQLTPKQIATLHNDLNFVYRKGTMYISMKQIGTALRLLGDLDVTYDFERKFNENYQVRLARNRYWHNLQHR